MIEKILILNRGKHLMADWEKGEKIKEKENRQKYKALA